jgi:hypothetical protein
VPQHGWRGSGTEYHLSWAGHDWILGLEEDHPGLRRPGHEGSILSLRGVACAGRSEPRAFCSGHLRAVEIFRGRVQATYEPPGWGGLNVRAAWSPTMDGTAVDFEVQATAGSVGELRALEILVASRLSPQAAAADGHFSRWVRSRDARAAGMTYDGREPSRELARLTTLPLSTPDRPSFEPISIRSPWPDLTGWFLELAHPQDLSRQVVMGNSPVEPRTRFAAGVRHALFGHDLEKGVVLRGRLRSAWMQIEEHTEAALAAYRAFVAMPPPLGM